MTDDPINKKDLELVLGINTKVVQIQGEVALQNEEVIDSLDAIKDSQASMETKIDKIVIQGIDRITDQAEQISRDLFTIKVLYVTGLLTIIAQVVSMFVHH